MNNGFTEEFIRAGHEADNIDCKRCLPDYPRRCACGGLVHAQANLAAGEGYQTAYCCDCCGADYNEEPNLDEAFEREAEEVIAPF